jgi:hypothetical protein
MNRPDTRVHSTAAARAIPTRPNAGAIHTVLIMAPSGAGAIHPIVWEQFLFRPQSWMRWLLASVSLRALFKSGLRRGTRKTAENG